MYSVIYSFKTNYLLNLLFQSHKTSNTQVENVSVHF